MGQVNYYKRPMVVAEERGVGRVVRNRNERCGEGILCITEMWYTKKTRYRRLGLRAHINEDRAGIAFR